VVGGVSVALFVAGAGAAWLSSDGEYHVSSQRATNPAPVTVILAKTKVLPASYPPSSNTLGASQAGTTAQPVTTTTTSPTPSTSGSSTQPESSATPQRKHGFVINP
jgi:hypothetical protein